MAFEKKNSVTKLSALSRARRKKLRASKLHESEALARSRIVGDKAAKKKISPGVRVKINATAEDKPGVMRILRFGAVTVANASPDEKTLWVNIKAGNDALGRVKGALINPGVKLEHRAGVPKFRVDANDPRVIIREVDGRVERGRIFDGAFIAAE